MPPYESGNSFNILWQYVYKTMMMQEIFSVEDGFTIAKITMFAFLMTALRETLSAVSNQMHPLKCMPLHQGLDVSQN